MSAPAYRSRSLVAGLAWVGGLALCAVGLARSVAERLPAPDRVAEGVQVDGASAPRGAEVERWLAERTAAKLAQGIALTHDGEVVLKSTLGELGATVDEPSLRRALAGVGHRGGWLERLDDARGALAGRKTFTTRIRIPIGPLERGLAALKVAVDVRPTGARWDFDAQRPTTHRVGRSVDVYATAEALAAAVRGGSYQVAVVLTPLLPRATTETVASIDRATLVSRHETRFAFLGGQAGRAQNVARAAQLLDGTVLMPGEIFSFNAAVGPRSLANGFAQAGEIYKGELRLGVGGGTCQVATTLYAASFFGGLDVVERSPHSRPSGYVPPGLDATVAYPHVDLKLRNPFPFPVVVHAELEPGRLAFALYGQDRPATVTFETTTLRVRPPARKVREAGWLAEGRVVRKQKGTRGLTIARVRTVRFRDGTERVEQSRDVYPPADEIYLIPRGGDPDELLPPLPSEEPAKTASGEGSEPSPPAAPGEAASAPG